MEDNSDKECIHPTENIASVETIIDLDKNSIEDIFKENDTDSVTSVELEDSTSEINTEMPYSAISEISNKLISFLDMKEKIKLGFLCKQCIFETSMEGISWYIICETNHLWYCYSHKNDIQKQTHCQNCPVNDKQK